MQARRWEIGGALGAILTLAIGWFFFIGPRNDETASLHARDDGAQTRLLTLQHRLVELRQQNGKLDQYRAQLAQARQALPTDAGLTDFLRQLQTAGTAAGVSVNGLTVGNPTPVITAVGQLYALPMTLVAAGTSGQLAAFLDQLQQVQPRAVLITSVNGVPAALSQSLAGQVTMTLTLQAFVAPPTGVGNPPPPAKTN